MILHNHNFVLRPTKIISGMLHNLWRPITMHISTLLLLPLHDFVHLPYSYYRNSCRNLKICDWVASSCIMFIQNWMTIDKYLQNFKGRTHTYEHSKVIHWTTFVFKIKQSRIWMCNNMKDSHKNFSQNRQCPIQDAWKWTTCITTSCIVQFLGSVTNLAEHL
jgi:hypothetical protein